MYWCINCDNLVSSNFDYDKLICKRCDSSNIINIPDDIKMTVGELMTLREISMDNNFLESMIHLKEKDPIEYQLKLSQFKTQVQQQETSRAQAVNTVKCPRCGSANVTAGQRGFSLLTGFVGSGRTVNRCANCGYKWKP